MNETKFLLWLDEWKVFVNPVLSFCAALIGLYFASKLTERREAKKEKIQSDKETRYLAILVTAHLDKVVKSCMSVMLDDGNVNERSGSLSFATSPPVFDPLAIDADWRVLPTDLMQKVLELPYNIERIEERLVGIWENDFGDCQDCIDARQYDYAVLGLATASLMRSLREDAGIPFPELKVGEWSRDEFISDKIQKIEDQRKKFQERLNDSIRPEFIPAPPTLDPIS